MNQPLIKALQDPALFDHPIYRFEVIETHISWVLLTGDYAYKIKKPVDFGFLDFSSLEKRHHFCQEELRLNRRLAPQLYLEVVAIGGTPDRPVLVGAGKSRRQTQTRGPRRYQTAAIRSGRSDGCHSLPPRHAGAAD